VGGWRGDLPATPSSGKQCYQSRGKNCLEEIRRSRKRNNKTGEEKETAEYIILPSKGRLPRKIPIMTGAASQLTRTFSSRENLNDDERPG